MLRDKIIVLAVALGAVLAPTLANAQQRPPGDDMRRATEERTKSIRGWPGGIVFTCVVTPADLDSEPVKQICANAATNAGALAGQAKVKFVAAQDPRTFLSTLLRERALGLTVQISPTDFNAPVAALVVRLYASRPYSDLVSATAIRGQNPQQNPLATPRAGDVTFWEELVVGSGPPAQLAPGIAPAIDAKLRQFYIELTGTAPKR